MANLTRRGGLAALAMLSVTLTAACADELLTSEVAGGGALSASAGGGLDDGQFDTNSIAAQPPTGSGVVYALPKAFVPMRLSRGDDGALSLSFRDSVLFPDPAHTYTLAYDPNSMSADQIDIRTTPDGLLQRISTTARDETAAVGMGLARLAGQVARAASPMGPGAAMAGGMLTQSSGFESLGGVEPFDISILADPTSETFEDVVAEALERVGVSDVVVERVDLGPKPERRSTAELRAFCQGGACYRRSTPVGVQATSIVTGSGVLETVLLPNEGVVGRIDFQRQAFVENRAEAVFEQGMLTEVSYNDPSSAAAMVAAPADILQSVLDIPASVFRSDADVMQAESNALRARSALLAERQALLDAELRLREAELAAQAARGQ